MAEVNAKDLTTKTTPASTDSMLLFGTTSNEGAKITVDNLADNILGRLTTKTFANQVGGSSAATLLAQLSTLNSNLKTSPFVLRTVSALPRSEGGYFVTASQTMLDGTIIPAYTMGAVFYYDGEGIFLGVRMTGSPLKGVIARFNNNGWLTCAEFN